jgi:phytoene synthase
MNPTTIEKARQIEQRHGTSYYLATLFLKTPVREAVFVLYAFVRIADEIVDNPPPGTDPVVALTAWKQDWQHCYQTGESTHDILRATRDVFISYQIPLSLSEEFIDAMIMDLTVTRYESYAALKSYMRGSAEVVGLMLTRIFGYQSDEAFPHAAALGEAMQLTNFLRDIREDYEERGRIYLPQDLMTKHGVTEAMIAHHTPTSEFCALMKELIQKARVQYRAAEPGVTLLNPAARRAVTLAARFYEAILDEIEAARYDVFSQRVRTSRWRKLTIILKTYVFG